MSHYFQNMGFSSVGYWSDRSSIHHGLWVFFPRLELLRLAEKLTHAPAHIDSYACPAVQDDFGNLVLV